MNKAFNTVVVFNGYPISVVVAIVLHLLILALLIYLQSNSNADSLELVQPTIVKALFIDENPQVAERRRLERVEMQRIAEQRRQQELEEAQRQAEAERQRTEQERQRQEAERERAALVERERLERQRELEAQRERERQEAEQERVRQEDLAESERRRQEDLRRQQEQQDRLARQAEAEAAAAEAARNEFELVQSATGLIQQLLQGSWSRPPSARNGMRAILQISMLPTGELVDVRITQSSGDAAFDRSAERAVYAAAPFSELQSLPIRVFNDNFRSLSLIFEPQDLLN